jgi:hypothetical protein
MIDYSKTQNTLQALCLMFTKLDSQYLRKQIKRFTRETNLITYLTQRNNDR